MKLPSINIDNLDNFQLEYLNQLKNKVPNNYFCATCKVKGCKLWLYDKTSNTGQLVEQVLYCMNCGLPKVGIYKQPMLDYQGLIINKSGKSTDCIQDLYPAIPESKDKTWWLELPTNIDIPTKKPVNQKQKKRLNEFLATREVEEKKNEKEMQKIEQKEQIFECKPHLRTTKNGSTIISFKDKIGQSCCVRNSIINKHYIYFGVDRTHLKVKAELIGAQTIINIPQMTLTKESLEILIPILIGWYTTGKLEILEKKEEI